MPSPSPCCRPPAGRGRRAPAEPQLGGGPTSGVIGILVVLGAVFLAQQVDPALLPRWAGVPILVAHGQWYRMFTPVLLHVDVVHIGLNAYALWILGPPVE